MMRSIYYALACVTAMVSVPVLATDVGFGAVQLGVGSPVQLGRLSRNNIQQDWTGTEAFPGTINPTTSYAYKTIALPFAANAYQSIFYDITFDNEGADLFASAYVDNYDPTNLAKNWIGDAGSSGNYFPGDPRFFDVVVPTGHSLVLVVNSPTGRVATTEANYFVTAYSDTEFNENFSIPAVPETTTWAMMILGMGAIGLAMRQQKLNTRVSYAG